jgi:hypothetical protein
MARGHKTGGRQKGTPNKRKAQLAAKLAEADMGLRLDPPDAARGLMPLAVPLMIEGLTVGAWPLVFVAVLQLATGKALRDVNTVVGMRVQPHVKWT